MAERIKDTEECRQVLAQLESGGLPDWAQHPTVSRRGMAIMSCLSETLKFCDQHLPDAERLHKDVLRVAWVQCHKHSQSH